MLRNFLFRVQQYIHDNRARLIKAGLIALAIFVGSLMIYRAIERAKDRQYQNRIQTLEQDRQAADARSKQSQAAADEFQRLYEEEKARGREIETRAEAADAALQNARKIVAPLKEQYETIRYIPVDPDTPTSVASTCAELADLKYFCK